MRVLLESISIELALAERTDEEKAATLLDEVLAS